LKAKKATIWHKAPAGNSVPSSVKFQQNNLKYKKSLPVLENQNQQM